MAAPAAAAAGAGAAAAGAGADAKRWWVDANSKDSGRAFPIELESTSGLGERSYSFAQPRDYPNTVKNESNGRESQSQRTQAIDKLRQEIRADPEHAVWKKYTKPIDRDLLMWAGFRDPDTAFPDYRVDYAGNVVCRFVTSDESLFAWELDHLFPWACGGTTVPLNLTPLHMQANRVKSDTLILPERMAKKWLATGVTEAAFIGCMGQNNFYGATLESLHTSLEPKVADALNDFMSQSFLNFVNSHDNLTKANCHAMQLPAWWSLDAIPADDKPKNTPQKKVRERLFNWIVEARKAKKSSTSWAVVRPAIELVGAGKQSKRERLRAVSRCFEQHASAQYKAQAATPAPNTPGAAPRTPGAAPSTPQKK